MKGAMMFKAQCGTRFYIQDVLAYQPSLVGMMGERADVVLYLRGREQPISIRCDIEELDRAVEDFWNSLEDDVDSLDDSSCCNGCDCEDSTSCVECMGEETQNPQGEKEPA